MSLNLNQQAKKTTFIPIEALGIKIEVIYTNDVTNLTKFVNEMPSEYRNLLTKEKHPRVDLQGNKIELTLDECDYFLDYFFYTVDNNLKKYKFVITEKPAKEEMKDIFCESYNMLDDILVIKGLDIPMSPNQERQLRNELGAYIGQTVWDFCENKLTSV